MRASFAALGVETEYGGPHSNGITHMALLGFDDGSYLELVSTLEAGVRSPIWDRQIRLDAGPTAWALRVEDVAEETARLRAVGHPVEGPVRYDRRRPDGIRPEWEMAFPGGEEARASPGVRIPFFLADRTPRSYRVRPSPGVSGTELTGVAAVVCGVRDPATSVREFRGLYGLPAPREIGDETLGSRLLGFDGAPVILASPHRTGAADRSRDATSWLARRLAAFGDLPCAFLIGSDDFAASLERFADSLAPSGPERVSDRASAPNPGSESTRWWDRPVAWLDPDTLGGHRLGIIG